tara:strand:+ start:2794 stop:2919 length:126 start_codon:yes stop_codon:yes gene_type:complete
MITAGTHMMYGTGLALIVCGATIWASFILSLFTGRTVEQSA